MNAVPTRSWDSGDLVIVLLASTLSGLSHRLRDGFPKAAECVAETVAITTRESKEVPIASVYI
jgi:hypothetical protein